MSSPRYELSPGAGFLFPESHRIPNRILQRTTPVPVVNIPGEKNAANIKIATKDISFNPGMHGTFIGGGVLGKVYACQVTQELLDDLKRGFEAGGVKVFDSFPALGSVVIVKIVKQTRQKDADFIADSAHENIVHSILSSTKCKPADIACVSKFVPRFYLSFVARFTGYHECITVMDSAGNKPLVKYAQEMRKSGGRDYVEFYARAEQAVCALWLAGYIHGDLHRENLMVDDKGHVELIDFGYAKKMPESFVTFISNGIKKMISSGSAKSFGELWTEGSMNGTQTVGEYVNRAMKGPFRTGYNADYKTLKGLYNDIPQGSARLLPDIRSKLWKITMTRTGDETPRENLMPDVNTGKVDSKKRKVFKDSKGRTYVKQGDKKVYVKKLFTPARNSTPSKSPAKSPMINTERVNAKKRKVFKDSKGRAYVKQGDKKVYVKKLFTPARNSTPSKSPAKSPMINTGKVNAKKRKVFKDSKGRTYVKQGDKKVYVKKLFTPVKRAVRESSET